MATIENQSGIYSRADDWADTLASVMSGDAWAFAKAAGQDMRAVLGDPDIYMDGQVVLRRTGSARMVEAGYGAGSIAAVMGHSCPDGQVAEPALSGWRVVWWGERGVVGDALFDDDEAADAAMSGPPPTTENVVAVVALPPAGWNAPRPYRRLPIYGERPIDAVARIIRDDPGFTRWLFGQREYVRFIGPDGKMDDVAELFWLLDGIHDAYDWSLFEVESVLAAWGPTHEADVCASREFARDDRSEDDDACDDEGHDAPKTFEAWDTARVAECLSVVARAKPLWLVRGLRRGGIRADAASLEHTCHVRLAPVRVPDHGGVYFIQTEPGIIKIGVASRIRDRVSSAQTYFSDKVPLLAWIDGDAAREREMHKRFAALRLDGGGSELFRLTGELLQFVKERQAEILMTERTVAS